MPSMLSYPHRSKSGHITCYLNRTYHVLTTDYISTIDKNRTVGALWGRQLRFFHLAGNQCMNWRESMSEIIRRIWAEDAGQDIAEYAVMLAVILVLVVGTIRLIGSNANNVFSNTASSISQ